LRFDHHQREFTGVLDGYNTKLSSAGLVYKHFGRSIVKNILLQSSCDDEAFVEICYQKVYKNFVEHIDAIDNGIAISDGPLRYAISSSLSSRVGTLNPAWNEPQTVAAQNERFREAMKLTCCEFVNQVESLAKIWWPARSIVQSSFANRFNIHPSGSIVVLEQACPWKDHLYDVEQLNVISHAMNE
jgi:uncharacterized UPF0160 family protein